MSNSLPSSTAGAPAGTPAGTPASTPTGANCDAAPAPRRLGSLIASSLALLLAACASTAPPSTTASGAPVVPGAATGSAGAALARAGAQSPAQASQAAGAPLDPLRPDVDINLDDRSARTDLWQRVRAGFRMPDLGGELVQQHEQWYASRPDYVQRMTERGSRYLFHIVEEVNKRGMPTELALLPFIESAFNPQAVSSANASGMWQFMPATGRDFDLRQNMFRDDRRDVLASTRAALDYLERLHGMFGDWHLALAAYNWGEGSVQRAIARNEKAGLPTDYGSLRMPDETRHYVPKLQAVKNLFAQPDNFGIALPALENHPYFLTVPIERDIDVELALKLSGLPKAEFQSLNPQMKKPVILAAGTPHLLLPYDNANAFVRNLARHRGALASWTAWVVPRTMKAAAAAEEAGMSEQALREVNDIPARMLVKAGSTLLIARTDQHRDVSERVADNAVMQLAPDVPPLRRIAFKAGRKGTTVAAVARQYRLSAAQVAQWNHVGAQGRFAPGAQIVVHVPNRGAVAMDSEAAAATHSAKASAAPTRTAQAADARSRGAKAVAASTRIAKADAKRGRDAARPATKQVAKSAERGSAARQQAKAAPARSAGPAAPKVATKPAAKPAAKTAQAAQATPKAAPAKPLRVAEGRAGTVHR